jgi:hypothetical protein
MGVDEGKLQTWNDDGCREFDALVAHVGEDACRGTTDVQAALRHHHHFSQARHHIQRRKAGSRSNRFTSIKTVGR